MRRAVARSAEQRRAGDGRSSRAFGYPVSGINVSTRESRDPVMDERPIRLLQLVHGYPPSAASRSRRVTDRNASSPTTAFTSPSSQPTATRLSGFVTGSSPRYRGSSTRCSTEFTSTAFRCVRATRPRSGWPRVSPIAFELQAMTSCARFTAYRYVPECCGPLATLDQTSFARRRFRSIT